MSQSSVDEAIVIVPVSASEAIRNKLATLAKKREQDGLQSLTKIEWTLSSILNKAYKALQDGRCEFNAHELREYMLANLCDEGVDAWRTAFDAALAEARRVYFVPHPDSQ